MPEKVNPENSYKWGIKAPSGWQSKLSLRTSLEVWFEKMPSSRCLREKTET